MKKKKIEIVLAFYLLPYHRVSLLLLSQQWIKAVDSVDAEEGFIAVFAETGKAS